MMIYDQFTEAREGLIKTAEQLEQYLARLEPHVNPTLLTWEAWETFCDCRRGLDRALRTRILRQYDIVLLTEIEKIVSRMFDVQNRIAAASLSWAPTPRPAWRQR
ncbi:hypothetical protein OPU71_10265 [Niveibacterium sp. 24ML]|uniref:hypothetical protein n=1 Tax=Niveibacterium sp. 24ML TaxID=2985512 RepID=UPI002270DB7A|nr:hypothetical protein [Niveibacterium sp. 24ML]MCX9156505.1 hypothetical protein [Niveibacterium sp. 24ML]